MIEVGKFDLLLRTCGISCYILEGDLKPAKRQHPISSLTYASCNQCGMAAQLGPHNTLKYAPNQVIQPGKCIKSDDVIGSTTVVMLFGAAVNGRHLVNETRE